MNAVAGLITDITRMEKTSCEQFEPFFEEGQKVQKIIQALADAVLGQAGMIRKNGTPLFEYPFLQEGEGLEEEPGHEAQPLPSSAANYISLTLTSLQINSLAGTLGEAFSGFASQTSALAGIYSPLSPPSGTHAPELLMSTVSLPPSQDAAGARPVTPSAGTGTITVLESLNRSASVLRMLETVRTNLTRNLSFSGSAVVGTPPSNRTLPSGRILQHSSGLEQQPAQAVSTRTVPATGNRYPEPLGMLFSPFHRMLQRPEILSGIPIPAMVPEGHPPFPQITGPGTETAGEDFPVTVYRPDAISGHAVTAGRVPGAAEFRPVTQKKPSRRTAGGRHPATGTGIIEIPSLVPVGGKDMRSDMAAANAARLSEGIARLSGDETRQAVLPSGPGGTPPASIRVARGMDLSSPEVSVPGAFEMITRYLTYSSGISRVLLQPLYGGSSGGETGPGFFSVPLPFTGSGAGGNLPAGLILQGKDIRPAGNYPVMNLAVSMVNSDVMQKNGLFPLSAAAGSPHMAVTPAGAFPGPSLVSPVYSLEHALPQSAVSSGETLPPAGGGGSTVHFQNTFNITVTTAGRGTDAEMRELGKKIGVILSDELKRYGGLR